MSKYIKITSRDRNLLKLNINNCDVSLVNSIRRIILSEVPTVGFKMESYEDSDIKIIKNTSSLHNEFLIHRISEIPIYIENTDTFDPLQYTFELNVENSGTKIINVTTKDIVITDNNTKEKIDSSILFPPDPITGDHILITKLKSNPNGEGEVFHFIAKASLGIGKEHAAFSPVSNVSYTNVIDSSKYEVALKKHVVENVEDPDILDQKDVDKMHKSFKITEGERYFKTDQYDRPSEFDFTIESIGAIPSANILTKSIFLLVVKIKKFMNNLINAQLNIKNDVVEVYESQSVMKGFDIIIYNETHTLGNLVQSYIQRLYSKEVNFVGYNNPHPLKKSIVLRISTADNDLEKTKAIIGHSCQEIITICDEIKAYISSEFGLEQIKIKRKKPKSK